MEKKAISSKQAIILTLSVLGFLIVLSPVIFVVLYAFFRPFQVNGHAMSPNYKNGQFYLAKIKHDNFKRGDVVVFVSPENSEKDLVKRIIALPNETLLLKEGVVYINGKALDESKYLPPDTVTYGGEHLFEGDSITVPDSSYFVLGDNRTFSSDSRAWGVVPEENIISTFLFCYWNCK